MVVMLVSHINKEGDLHIHLHGLASQATLAFKPEMFAMALPFAVFGGLTGFLIGWIMDRKRQFIEMKHENEKQEVALQTLAEVIEALAHHLLNANMIIGGKVRRCLKTSNDDDLLQSLAVIQEQGYRVDAVIKAMRNVSRVKTADFATGGQIEMKDIAGDIDEQIKQAHEEHLTKQ
jgi:light-regulated signal transduction histidine kinase (bacteriophytochrome)